MNMQTPGMRASGATHTADATTAEEGLAIQEAQAKFDSDTATGLAMQNTLLTPRFYTTDFDELDAIDVTSVRDIWDELIAEMQADPNKGHFKKNEDWDHVDWDGMEPELKKEFIDFLVSSCTAEFSGCVLYKEMKRRGANPDVTGLFQLMARDEARHAGFINDALREAGVAVNLGFLTKAKKYTYFRPKFIYYATNPEGPRTACVSEGASHVSATSKLPTDPPQSPCLSYGGRLSECTFLHPGESPIPAKNTGAVRRIQQKHAGLWCLAL